MQLCLFNSEKNAVAYLADAAACLSWIERQNLNEFGVGQILNTPNPCRYYVGGDSDKIHYGKTLQEAISMAIRAEDERN